MHKVDYPMVKVQRLVGTEGFHDCRERLPVTLLDFWQWSASDLVSNLLRGRLAEFIVALATGVKVTEGVRSEWDPFDVTTPEGVKVEVKSTAYLQSWYQKDLSNISWRVGPTRKWDAATSVFDPEARWQADVYVFALFAQRNKKVKVNPLHLARWEFYVVPVEELRPTMTTRTITVPWLNDRGIRKVGYAELAAAIQTAAPRDMIFPCQP